MNTPPTPPPVMQARKKSGFFKLYNLLRARALARISRKGSSEEVKPTSLADREAAAAAESWGRADETPTRNLEKSKAVPNLDAQHPSDVTLFYNECDLPSSKIRNKIKLLSESQPTDDAGAYGKVTLDSPTPCRPEPCAVSRKLCFEPCAQKRGQGLVKSSKITVKLSRAQSENAASQARKASYTEMLPTMLDQLRAAALPTPPAMAAPTQETALAAKPATAVQAGNIDHIDYFSSSFGTDTFLLNNGPYQLRPDVKHVVKPRRKKRRKNVRDLWRHLYSSEV